MDKPLLVVRPRLFVAVLPKLLKNVVRYGVAGLVVYFLFAALSKAGLLSISIPRLVIAVVVVSLLLAAFHIKFHVIRLHRTKYKFYDSHLVEEQSVFNVRRRSLPYSHVTKIVNDRNVWNRISGATDMRIYSSQGQENILLRSIKDSEKLEHKIHKLINSHAKGSKDDLILH